MRFKALKCRGLGTTDLGFIGLVGFRAYRVYRV